MKIKEVYKTKTEGFKRLAMTPIQQPPATAYRPPATAAFHLASASSKACSAGRS